MMKKNNCNFILSILYNINNKGLIVLLTHRILKLENIFKELQKYFIKKNIQIKIQHIQEEFKKYKSI